MVFLPIYLVMGSNPATDAFSLTLLYLVTVALHRSLKELHWLPVQYRIQYKILVHTYNAPSPLYIKEMLLTYIPSRPLRSQNSLTLATPRGRTAQYGQRCFAHSAPRLWNALPEKITEDRTIFTLKKLLDSHLCNHNWPLIIKSFHTACVSSILCSILCPMLCL